MATRRKDEADLIQWRPLTGLLDNRSQPDDMQPFSWRFRQNYYVPELNKLARSPGWTKLFSKTPYNNEDLHDQLISLQQYYDVVDETEDEANINTWPHVACGSTLHVRDTGRQPITMLFEANSSTGARTLFAGTDSRIYSLTESTGGWRMIADGYGEGDDDGSNPAFRFYATQNGDQLLFTNDFNEPLVHMLGQPFFGCDIQAVSTIEDLTIIGLSKAAVTWTWRNVTFLADVEMDGERASSRIVWSDFGDLTSWDPARPESIAGFQDLDYGERILGGAEMNDVFLIYTNRNIWEMHAVGGEVVFAFRKRYTPELPGEACLAYRNTLAAYRDTHYYCSADGFYAYNLHSLAPERLDWVHLATGIMFDDISVPDCDKTVACINDTTKELWISWVPANTTTGFPTRTLAVNLRFPAVHLIDHGFTTFTNFRSDPTGTVRDFILDRCICDIANLNILGYGYRKENIPLTETHCVTLLTSIYTDGAKTVVDAVVEDWEQPAHAAGSICQAIGDLRLDQLCRLCESKPVFVMASATDWALKEFNPNAFYREMVDPTDYNNVGSVNTTGYQASQVDYLQLGYESILRTGAMSFGEKREEKFFKRLVLMAKAAVQTTPNQMHLRVGTGSQPTDPNDEDACSLLWRTDEARDLECMDTKTAAGHSSARSRPSTVLEWPLYEAGYFIFFELKIVGTGGSCTFSEIELDVSARDARRRF